MVLDAEVILERTEILSKRNTHIEIMVQYTNTLNGDF